MTPPVTVIATTADRSGLFALIPQEHGRWELQRLKAWRTGSPRVESMTFDGDVSKNRLDYVRGGMIASPDGRYLMVRIFVLDTRQWKRSAVVLLIDLHKFTVVWRRMVDDPLVADARWRFVDAGTVIAVAGPPPTHQGHPVIKLMVSQDILRMNPVSPGKHEAGVLSFPNLEATSRCSYAIRKEDQSADGAQASSGRFVLDGDGCVGVLKAAHVSSFSQLPGLRELQELVGQPFGQGCEFEDRNATSELTLSNCRQGWVHKADDFRMHEEDEKVTRSSSSGVDEVLSVALKPWEDYSAVLASADGHDFLVLLREKLRIEAYEIR